MHSKKVRGGPPFFEAIKNGSMNATKGLMSRIRGVFIGIVKQLSTISQIVDMQFTSIAK